MTGPVASGDRAAMVVGAATLLIGGALMARPDRVGRLLAVDNPSAARVIGALDLALVPGLVLGPRRPLWLFGRGALNLGIAAHVLRAQRNTGRFGCAVTVAGVMVAATVGDSRTAYRSLTNPRAVESATSGPPCS